MRTRITSAAIGKGGPGKSTVAMGLATGLPVVEPGAKTLLIDYDPQGNASYAYQANTIDAPNLYHVYSGEADIRETIQHMPQGDIIPANQLLTKVEGLFDNYLDAVERLREALETVSQDYTHIIIDNQPLIGGLLTTQALAASGDLVIPITADVFSLQGLERLQQAIASIRKRINPNLRVDGLLLNKFNPRHTLSSGLLNSVNKWAEVNETRVYPTYIRESVAVREAQTLRQSLFDYAPQSNPARDLLRFIREDYLSTERSGNDG